MWNLFVDAAWKVTVAGFVFGVGLPVVFALGVRSSLLAAGDGGGTNVTSAAPAGANRLLGFLCFALVVIAVAIGLLVIIASGLGKEVSFDHVYPTVTPKG